MSDRRGSTDAWMIPVSNGHAADAPELLLKGLGDIESLGFNNQEAFYYVTQGSGVNVYIAGINPKPGKVIKVLKEPLPHIGTEAMFILYPRTTFAEARDKNF